MKIKFYIQSFLVIFSMASCAFKYPDVKMYTEVSQEAINWCVSRYKIIKKENISKEINRAYVHLGNNRIDIVFSKGSLGSFSERSDDYRSFFSCGLYDYKDMRIYYLSDSFQSPLIDDSNDTKVQGELYKGTVYEYLYLREGDIFLYENSRVFPWQDLK